MQNKQIKKFEPFCWWCGIEIPAGTLCFPHKDKWYTNVWSNGETAFTYFSSGNGSWTSKKTHIKAKLTP